MKKITLISIIALLCLSAQTANAGNPLLKFGIKAGIVSESQRFKTDWSDLKQAVDDKNIGFTLGAVLRISPPLIPIHFQPEFVYTRSKVSIDNFGFGSSKYKINTFSAPVMVGVDIGLGNMVRLRASTGPVFNFNTYVKSKNDQNNISGVFEKKSVSWAVGAGVDLLGIMIDLRYTAALNKQKLSLPSGHDIKTTPGYWSLTFGFMF